MGSFPPAIVMALAACMPQHGPLPPQPVAWKEYPGEWVIAFEDGRKLRFVNSAHPLETVETSAVKEPEPAPNHRGSARQIPTIVTPPPTLAETKAARRRRN